MTPHAQSAAARFPWLMLVLGGAAFVVLLALGSWQVQRLAWKEALIATIAERVASPPRPLAEIEALYDKTGDVDYWPVAASGVFDHAGERHFLATHDGASGWFVYTPMRLADGRVLFVNRGFVPYDRKDAALRPEGQLAGVQEVAGLARNPLAEKPSSIVPDNTPDKNVFYWKDIAAMAASDGISPEALVPFFVDAGDAKNPGGLPIGGVTLIEMPNNHLQYAVTWYGLAAALAGVMGVWLWGRRFQPPRA